MTDPIFQEPDWSSTTGAMQSVQHGAARIGKALARSFGLLPSVVGEQALQLFSAENLWATALILAFWLFASVVGGPIGLAVNGVLIALALYQVPELAKTLGTLLKDGVSQAAAARNEADLDGAAKTFATLISTIGLEAFQLFITHRVFVALKPRLLKRFKVPQDLVSEHRKAKASNQTAARQTERLEKAKRLERLANAAEIGAAAGVKPAAKAAGDLAPTIGLAALGIAGAGAVVVAVILASKEANNGR